MKQNAVLAVTLVFIAFLAGLVIVDVSEYGVTPLDVTAVPILVFFSIAIVRALLQRPGR
jgi:hypothetical protein